jgi:hypothetical protein
VTRTTKRLFLCVSIVALTLAAATVMLSVRAARPTKIVRGNTTRNMDGDGAFRDGLYLGKLDAESGRKPHLSIGRWNTARDRASFVAGYQQGYRQVQAVKIGE